MLAWSGYICNRVGAILGAGAAVVAYYAPEGTESRHELIDALWGDISQIWCCVDLNVARMRIDYTAVMSALGLRSYNLFCDKSASLQGEGRDIFTVYFVFL